MNTQPAFLENTFCFEIASPVLGSGKDEEGYYFIPESTVCYPGGGGQEPDKAVAVAAGSDPEPVLKAVYRDGAIYHYTERQLPADAPVSIQIDELIRVRNARLHTAGHLLASVIYELLKLPLVPVKGFHYQQGAYVEFSSMEEKETLNAERINAALESGIAEGRKIITRIVEAGSEEFTKAFKPAGFLPPPGKPLRLVQIDGFFAYPCGGTHLNNTGELRFVRVKGIKNKKGNIRISYEAE